MDPKIKAYCMTHGVLFADGSIPPITLQPSSFPRAAFEQAMQVSPEIAELFFQKIPKEDACRIEFAVMRVDFMLDGGDELKLVEVNTIASSLFGLSTQLCSMYKEAPSNTALQDISAAFNKVNSMFNETYCQSDTIGVMFVQREECNLFDQMHLVSSIDFPMFRIPLDDPNLKMDRGFLTYRDRVVSVVYFRTGYNYEDYFNERCHSNRAMVESSLAVKCPNARIQAAGRKSVQAAIKDVPKDVAKVWTRFYKPEEIISFDEVVMKTMREGGNEIVTGDAIKEHLHDEGVVFMDRIKPKAQPVLAIRSEEVKSFMGVSELGIFCALISLDGSLVECKATGYLLRTKPEKAHGGGVAAGHAFIDVPILK